MSRYQPVRSDADGNLFVRNADGLFVPATLSGGGGGDGGGGDDGGGGGGVGGYSGLILAEAALLAYWDLQDTGDGAADSSGNDRDLTLNGALTFETSTGLDALPKCITFSSTASNYLSIPIDDSWMSCLYGAAAKWSYECVVRRASAGGSSDRCLMGLGAGSGQTGTSLIARGDALSLQNRYAGWASSMQAVGTIWTGEFHHVVATSDQAANTSIIYIDGEVVGTGSATQPSGPGAAQFFSLGASGSWPDGAPDLPLDADMMGVAVYSDVLSPETVAAHAAAVA